MPLTPKLPTKGLAISAVIIRQMAYAIIYIYIRLLGTRALFSAKFFIDYSPGAPLVSKLSTRGTPIASSLSVRCRHRARSRGSGDTKHRHTIVINLSATIISLKRSCYLFMCYYCFAFLKNISSLRSTGLSNTFAV